MELKDFISATLLQVIEGIEAAQKSGASGANVNADMGGSASWWQPGQRRALRRRHCVDFDVSGTAQTSGGATGKISVFSVGAEGGLQHKNTSANRIAFSVPLRLPDGDKTRAESVRAKDVEGDRARKARLPSGGFSAPA